jgi:hypothetical protein
MQSGRATTPLDESKFQTRFGLGERGKRTFAALPPYHPPFALQQAFLLEASEGNNEYEI